MSAVERVEAFLAERETLRGLDPDFIAGANYAGLRVSDLRALIAEAETRGAAKVRERVEATGWRDELRELSSFVLVETGHIPTHGAIAELRGRLNAALTPEAVTARHEVQPPPRTTICPNPDCGQSAGHGSVCD